MTSLLLAALIGLSPAEAHSAKNRHHVKPAVHTHHSHKHVRPAPRNGFTWVWVTGHWERRGKKLVWVRGYWDLRYIKKHSHCNC